MTQREMLTAVVAQSVITEDMVKVAQAMLDKMSNKDSKAKAELEKVNAPLKVAFVDYLGQHPKALASELAKVLDVSTSKVVALGKVLVAENLVKVEKVKFPKVGERNVYSLVVSE